MSASDTAFASTVLWGWAARLILGQGAFSSHAEIHLLHLIWLVLIPDVLTHRIEAECFSWLRFPPCPVESQFWCLWCNGILGCNWSLALWSRKEKSIGSFGRIGSIDRPAALCSLSTFSINHPHIGNAKMPVLFPVGTVFISLVFIVGSHRFLQEGEYRIPSLHSIISLYSSLSITGLVEM